MNRLKVITIVGTRPEIIRLSRLMAKLDEYTDHVLVHTGQNFDRQLNEVFFEDLDLRAPDYFLNVDTTSLGAVMGETLRKSEEVFRIEKPDAVMILGDTNSSIAAIVAERMHIPVYHMEAGNRSFDARVPEELNRRMVDHVASFNLPYNDYSLRNLLSEGIHPRFTCKTGSPMAEIYNHYRQRIEESQILGELEILPKQYILVSVHRQENVDSPERLSAVVECLVHLHRHLKLPVLVSTHPRTRLRLQSLDIRDVDGVEFHEPFGYLDYLTLQKNAFCVVSDSGTIGEESAIIGFPAVTLRDSIERPEAIEVGSLILTGLNPDALVQAIEVVTRTQQPYVAPEGYEILDFSERVLRFLMSTARLHKVWRNLT